MAAADRVRLAPHYRAVFDPDGSCVLLSEAGNLRLTGLGADVVRAAADSAAVADVVRGIGPAAGPHAARGALMRLMERGILVPDVDTGHDPDGTGVETAPGLLALAAEGLDTQRIRGVAVTVRVVDGVAGSASAECTEALARLGMVPRTGPTAGAAPVDDDHLTVVLTPDYLSGQLADIGAELTAERRPWLLARPAGLTAWVGPVFPAGGRPCLECLTDRLRGHRSVEVTATRGTAVRHAPAIPGPSGRVAAELLALEAARYAAGRAGVCATAVVTVDLRTFTSARHAVAARPQCPVCGDPSVLRVPMPAVRLVDRPSLTAEGGLRSGDPLLWFDRHAHLVGPVTGVTAGIHRSADLPPDSHLYIAGPVVGGTWSHVTEIAKSFVPGGKGRTAAQARASALGESIERHSIIWREPRHEVVARWEEVADSAVDPGLLLGFSPRQYRERDRTNSAGVSKVHWVPRPFDRDEPIGWTSAWSLGRDAPVLLPSQYCFLGYVAPGDDAFYLADTNGCAAGATPEEAMLQGANELVERDAVGIWWYNRARRPGLPLPPGATDRFAGLDRTVHLLDLTTDVQVPVVAAVSALRGTGRGVVVGFGADRDRRVAVDRALTEAVQCVFGLLGPIDPWYRRWTDEVDLDSQPWLVADPTAPLTAGTADRSGPRSVVGDLAHLTGRLAAIGIDLVAVDMTLPDVGVPVFRMVGPGLVHFWPRRGFPRLYQAPVTMGWVGRATPEVDLNPWPITW